MRALFVLGALTAALLTTPAPAAVVVDLPLDQQINQGVLTNPTSPLGDAIYIPASFSEQLSFQPDPTGGFARVSIAGGSWWYGPYVDFRLAGIPSIDVSEPGCTISFDARFFQPESNTNRYGDAPIFLRLYSYQEDNVTLTGYRDYGIVYATQSGDAPYPDWTRVVVNANASTATDTGQNNLAFDPANVTRMRMYGTDWFSPANQFGSFIDVRNFSVVCPDGGVIPEPGTMALLAMGAVPLLGLRRRKA